MSKEEFINRYVSPANAKVKPKGTLIHIEHACGCVLCIDATQSPQEWADLCPKHREQYEQLKNKQQ